MVSEAVQSGKAVIVFRLKNKRKKAGKFERMLDRLEGKGCITIAESDKISEAICGNFSKSATRPMLPDMHEIYMNMWRLGV